MNQIPADPYDPCPCGSGAKYKFCCRDKDREAERANPAPASFPREHFDQFAEELGLKERLGEQGAEELYRLTRKMEENQRTRKTRRLTQMETQVDPKLPAVAVDLSAAYPKPDPVRARGKLLRPGDPITRESIARIKQDPVWQDGEEPQELIQDAFLPLLNGWQRHLTGALRLPREEVSRWRPLVEDFIMRYLPAYDGKLAIDMGKKAHVLRQYLGNFYPRKFMDCSLESIYQALKGTASFYVYLHHLGLLDCDQAAGVVKVCADHEFFRRRLEGYFRAEGDEMRQWVEEWGYDGTMTDNP